MEYCWDNLIQYRQPSCHDQKRRGAVLRMVLDRPTPPATLSVTPVQSAFQEVLAQSRLFVAQTTVHEDVRLCFLWRYRPVQPTTLRRVSPDEHPMLQLFQQQPGAC